MFRAHPPILGRDGPLRLVQGLGGRLLKRLVYSRGRLFLEKIEHEVFSKEAVLSLQCPHLWTQKVANRLGACWPSSSTGFSTLQIPIVVKELLYKLLNLWARH